MSNISTEKTKAVLKKSDANNCSIVHYMLAIGVSKSTQIPKLQGTTLWDLFESQFEPTEWSTFFKEQLEGNWSKCALQPYELCLTTKSKVKCSFPDIVEYGNDPLYPHEIVLKYLSFSFLVDTTDRGQKSNFFEAFYDLIGQNPKVLTLTRNGNLELAISNSFRKNKIDL